MSQHLVARWVYFDGHEEKAAYMQRGAENDARSAEVQRLAVRWVVLPELERARAIFRFVQWGITYRRDPATWRDGQRHGIEVLDNSLVALDRGFGDCDAKARLLVALCLAAGLDAKIDPVIRHGSFVHVRAQICVEGRWLVADPSILNSDVGELPARAITNLRAS